MIKPKKQKIIQPMEKFEEDESFDLFDDDSNISIAM